MRLLLAALLIVASAANAYELKRDSTGETAAWKTPLHFVIDDQLGVRLSYSGEYSDSYFYQHYAHKNAVYLALKWVPNSRYQLDFNAEVNSQSLLKFS